MDKETKTDIFKMFYQFVFAGAIFWIAIYGKETPIIGSVVAPLYYLQENYGMNAWGLIVILFMIIGIIGIFIQRKIHIKQHGKK